MELSAFSVLDWAAWAPGLHDRDAWQAWAQRPLPPHGDAAPAAAEIPALLRRRIDRLGRMAMQAACGCDGAVDAAVPLVFASRHGEVSRSVQLLQALAAGEAMSPTAFGLSVHNAIAAVHSIARGRRGNYLAIAAGPDTAETACVEAAGLLADGAPEVLVVCYEAPLPDCYAGFADGPEAPFAWCWRIAPVQRGGVRLALSRGPAAGANPGADAGTGAALPRGLEVLRFLLSGDAALATAGDGGGMHWVWRRHG